MLSNTYTHYPRYIPNTYTQHIWTSLNEVYILGNVYIYWVYIGYIYWVYVSGIYIGYIYWVYILSIYIGYMYWVYVLGICIGYMYWVYVLGICIGCIYLGQRVYILSIYIGQHVTHVVQHIYILSKIYIQYIYPTHIPNTYIYVTQDIYPRYISNIYIQYICMLLNIYQIPRGR